VSGLFGGDPVLAVIRRQSYDDIEPLVATLVQAGVTTLEFTLSGSGAVAAAVAAKCISPAVIAGIGTVRKAADIEEAIDAGLDFAVAPDLSEDIVGTAAGRITFLPGVFTPSEVALAVRLGCTYIKLFPASLAGPTYTKDLRVLYPTVGMVPSGGVRPLEVPAYLDAGAAVVSLGSELVGSVSAPLALDEVGRRARSVRAAADNAGAAPEPPG
jgi:2-dehydro-3-deoxyphosphogluconate aldolase/(4S)-4-hydroxy-2-oxoglutarate aldolase